MMVQTGWRSVKPAVVVAEAVAKLEAEGMVLGFEAKLLLSANLQVWRAHPVEATIRAYGCR